MGIRRGQTLSTGILGIAVSCLLALVTAGQGGAQAETRRLLAPDEFNPERTLVGTIVGDRLHGPARLYGENGSLLGTMTFRDGLLEGEQLMFYPDGSTFSRTPFRAGKINGTVYRCYPTGRLNDETPWRNGQPHGSFATYFEDGATASIRGQFVDGLAEGRRIHFIKSGEVFGYSYFERGQQVGQRLLIDIGYSDSVYLERTHLNLRRAWETGSPHQGGRILRLEGDRQRVRVHPACQK